jgi:hypothetical protein
MTRNTLNSVYNNTMKYYRYLQDYYENATDVLQMYYRSADYRSLHVTTVTIVTTGFVGISHGLLM